MAISEEYLLKFKGDNSQLKQKLSETSTAAEGLKTKVGGIGKAFGGIAAALSVGAIVGKFKSIANTMDEVGKSAIKLGVATDELSALKYAAELSDVSFSSLEGSIRKMQKAVFEASEGSETFIDAFARIGIKTQELQGLGVEEQFTKIASAVAAIEDPAKRTATAMELFGRSGTGVLLIAQDGAEGIKKLTDEARKLGVVFDAEAAAKAEKLNDDLTRLGASVDALFMQAAQEGAFDVMIGGIDALAKVIIYATTKYGDMLRAFGVEFNTQDTINNLTEGMQSDLEAAQSKLNRLQSDGISGYLANAHLSEAEIATQTAKTIEEINRIEGVIKNLKDNYGKDALKPTDTETEKPRKTFSGGGRNSTDTDKLGAIMADLQKELDTTKATVDMYGEKESAVNRATKAIEIQNRISAAGIKLSKTEKDSLNEKLDAIAMQEEAYNQLEETTKSLEDAEAERKRSLEQLANTFESSFEDAIVSGEGLGDVFKSLGEDIARLIIRTQIVQPLIKSLGGAMEGSSIFGGGGSGGLFSSIGSSLSSLFSFDGGGFTGNGARSGGLDGKGGMLSLVHPNETVLDHTKGQGMSGGGGVSVNQYNNNTFTSDTDIDRRIKAHLPIMMDTTKRAVLQALQSGGEYSKVNGSRL